MAAADVPERLLDRLAAATYGRRRRASVDLLLGGRPRLRDQAASELYYALSSSRWAARARDAGHLEPFVRGLELCAGPRRVLDLGTGTGATARVLAERFPEARVVGFDKSRAMLAHARRERRSHNLELRRGSARRLPFADAAFDLVTMLNFFPELDELRRVTRRGASVLMASSFGRLEDRSATYHGRWRAAGFERVAAADSGPGNYELFVRGAAGA